MIGKKIEEGITTKQNTNNEIILETQ